jgi:conjugal transfer/entry exclusion protein
MYGTYLRLDIAVHDSWRAVVRAAARKLTRQALRDPRCRAARKRFYRGMLDYHRQEQEIVATWRL